MSENVKKDIHHIHDKSYKDLYSKKEIAIDLFKSLVNEKWTEYLIPENLTLVNKTYVTADYEELEADIVYKANLNDTEVYLYILLEFQSTVDYRMPLRLLFYMCEILREHAVNAKHKKYDKSIKIPAVLPIVLYNGEQKWDVPREFRKMIYNEELFGSNILNFTYDVFDISNDEKFNKEELLISKNVQAAIFLLEKTGDALEFLEKMKVVSLYSKYLSQIEVNAIKIWIENNITKQISDSAINILQANKMEVELMIGRAGFISEEMRVKVKEEREKAIKEVREEGRKEVEIEVAMNLLDILDDKTISEKIGLDIKKVKELRNLIK